MEQFLGRMEGIHDIKVNFSYLEEIVRKIREKISISEQLIVSLEQNRDIIAKNSGKAIDEYLKNYDNIVLNVKKDKDFLEIYSQIMEQYISSLTSRARPLSIYTESRVNRDDSHNKLKKIKKITATLRTELLTNAFKKNSGFIYNLSEEEKQQAKIRGQQMVDLKSEIEIRVKEIERLVTEELGDNCHSRVIQYEELDTTYSYQMRELGENYERFEKNINSIHGIALEEELIYWKITEIFQKDPSEVTQSDYNYLIEVFNKALEKDLAGEGNPKELKNILEIFNMLNKIKSTYLYDQTLANKLTVGSIDENPILKKIWEKIVELEGEERIELINKSILLQQLFETIGERPVKAITIEKLGDLENPAYKIKAIFTPVEHKEILYVPYTSNLDELCKTALKDYLASQKKDIVTEITNYGADLIIGEEIRKLIEEAKNKVPGGNLISALLGVLIVGIEVKEHNEKLDNAINLVDLSSYLDMLCISGAFIVVDGKLKLAGASINYKELATKIYVYMKSKLKKDPNYEFPSLDVFLEQYRGNRNDLDDAASKLYGNIYIDNNQEILGLLDEKQKIEQIESWLKGE